MLKITIGAISMLMMIMMTGGCDGKSSSGYTKEQIIQKYSQHIPRHQLEAYIEGGNQTDANAAVLNLVKQGLSDQFDRDLANMRQ